MPGYRVTAPSSPVVIQRCPPGFPMFCPNCGVERTGAFRFCMSCKFDYDTLSTTTDPSAAGPNEVAAPIPDAALATAVAVPPAFDETQQVPIAPVPGPTNLEAGP